MNNAYKMLAGDLSWQTGWCPGPRTSCGAAGERRVRPKAPSPKTLVVCRTTECHHGRLIPCPCPYPCPCPCPCPSPSPCRRGQAGTWRPVGAPRPAASSAGSSATRTALYWAPISPGCRSPCTWAADGSRCSSAGGCLHLHTERFSPINVNFPTTRRLVSPSCCIQMLLERAYFVYNSVSQDGPQCMILCNTPRAL